MRPPKGLRGGGEEVEANTSGIQRLGNLESFLLIASEDDTAEAEFSIIGQVDRIIELGVFHDGDDRPENLFAGHPHLMGDIGEHGRLDKEAICQFTGGFPTAGGDAASRVGTRRDSVEGLAVTFERGTYEFKLGRLPQHEAAGVRALLINAAGA